MTAPAPAPPETVSLEGAGVFSSWADLNSAIGSGGPPAQVAFAAAAAGLDTLGFVANPFEGLISAGAGWAMEHVAFLREPLDFLAGDPGAVLAVGQGWHAVAVELAAVAEERRAGVGAAGSGSAAFWDGDAAGAYRLVTEGQAVQLATAAARADELAGLLVTTGATIGTVRSLVRDAIAEFVADMVTKLVVGGVVAALSGGVSLAAAVGWIVLDAIDLARRIAERISDLLTALAAAGGAAARVADGLRTAARVTGDVAVATNLGARSVDGFLDVRAPHLGAVVETGKQFSTASAEPGPPPG